MFSLYIEAALRRAKYETSENGTYMATVDGLRGVTANILSTLKVVKSKRLRFHPVANTLHLPQILWNL